MNETERLKQLLEQYKNEANSLLKNNKVDEADIKATEIKIVNAKIEVQEKLDEANSNLEEVKNQLTEKENNITDLNAEVETIKNEKAEIIDKFNEATEKVTDLNAKVSEMQPIVDEYNKKQYDDKVLEAKNSYKSKFEKCDALETFETEEVQNLIVDSVNKDKVISSEAKYSLSEKLLDMIDSKDSNTLDIKDINEPTKKSTKLNPEDDDFEATFGFKKE